MKKATEKASLIAPAFPVDSDSLPHPGELVVSHAPHCLQLLEVLSVVTDPDRVAAIQHAYASPFNQPVIWGQVLGTNLTSCNHLSSIVRVKGRSLPSIQDERGRSWTVGQAVRVMVEDGGWYRTAGEHLATITGLHWTDDRPSRGRWPELSLRADVVQLWVSPLGHEGFYSQTFRTEVLHPSSDMPLRPAPVKPVPVVNYGPLFEKAQ